MKDLASGTQAISTILLNKIITPVTLLIPLEPLAARGNLIVYFSARIQLHRRIYASYDS